MKVVGNHLIFPPIKFQSIWITRARDMAKILSSVVGNHLIFSPIKFQSIWITRARDMAKILSSASSGRGGQPSSSCLDEMSLLTSEFEQVVFMKVVGNCLIILGWIAEQHLTSLLWPNFEFENGRFGSSTIHEHCRPISQLSIHINQIEIQDLHLQI